MYEVWEKNQANNFNKKEIGEIYFPFGCVYFTILFRF